MKKEKWKGKRRVGKEEEEDEEKEEEKGSTLVPSKQNVLFLCTPEVLSSLLFHPPVPSILFHPPPPHFPSTRPMTWSSHYLSQLQWFSLREPKRLAEIRQRLKTYLVPSLLLILREETTAGDTPMLEMPQLIPLMLYPATRSPHTASSCHPPDVLNSTSFPAALSWHSTNI